MSLLQLHGSLWFVLALFFATFFNRFIGLRSGNGEFSGGMALLHDYLPYRDYFTAGPPLNAFKSACLLLLFPQKLITLRVFAVLERLLLGSIVLQWLRHFASQRAAWTAAVVTIVLSSGDRTDPLASYNHDSLFWAVLAGWLASCALDVPAKKLGRLGFFTGVCCGCALVTKQTVGGLVLVGLLLVPPALMSGSRKSKTPTWCGAFLAGAALPIFVVCGVLARMHLLRPALNMMFVTGPSAKAAHPGQFLMRWVLVAHDNLGWIALGLFWSLCCLHLLRRSLSLLSHDSCNDEQRGGVAPLTSTWLHFAVASCAIAVAVCLALERLPALHDFSKSVVYATVFLLPGIVGISLWVAKHEGWSLRLRRLVLFAWVSLITSFALALSWPAFEAMLLPGCAAIVALLIEGSGGVPRRVVYIALAFLCMMQLREKLNLPFGFDRQDEMPVYSATDSSTLEMLRGLRLPRTTVRFLDDTTTLIQRVTCSQDTIFSYPEFGLFYTLSDRHPPTWSPSHNMDVINDSVAAAEADRLLRHPPKVLILYGTSEIEWQGAERLWRSGHASGQRVLDATAEQLAKQYRLAGQYTLRPGDPPISVYVEGVERDGRKCQASPGGAVQ